MVLATNPEGTPRMPKFPNARWVEYTPESAAVLLEANTDNRKLRPHVVDRYRREMISKDWLPTGDTIKIASDGKLIDGQHRLSAIVAAGDQLPEPVPVLTVTGLDGDLVFAVTDTGLVRRPADVVFLAGHKNATVTAAMARLCIRFEKGRIFKRQSVSNASMVPTTTEVLRWLEQNPEVEDVVSYWTWRLHQLDVPYSPGLTAVWFMRRADLFRTDEFMESWRTLENLPAGSPILTLSKAVRRIRMDRTRLEQAQWVSLIFQAFNAWQREEEPRRFAYTSLPSRKDFPWPLSREEALHGAEHAALAREMADSEDEPTLPE